MKLQRPFALGVCIALIFLVSCSVPPVPISVAGTPLPTVTPSASMTPLPPTETPTLTPSPLPPTATASPTFTPAPPTLTPAPTLTAGERQTLVQEMLKTNGGCELPCWWGVTPGKTTLQTVRDLSASQGIELHFDPPISERLVRYRVDLYFVQQKDIVQSMDVRGEVLDPQSNHFAQDWQRYSLNQVLTRYGMPSQVLVELQSHCGDPPCGAFALYNLFVLYDQSGIMVRYLGPASRGDPITVCPVFSQVKYIQLWLRSPEPTASLLQSVNIDPDELSYMRPLTETTGMSIDTFYKTFKDPNNTKCITSPAKFWP